MTSTIIVKSKIKTTSTMIAKSKTKMANKINTKRARINKTTNVAK
jgi:hypothetical protein